jgi:drug/metabolite transporter (DMT)-like permease
MELLKQMRNARWFWYSMICVLCWGAWALLSKLGSREIPPNTMQFLFTVGTVPVGLALFLARRGKLEKSPRGIAYGVLNGILSGIGGLALFAAYHTDGNTTLITARCSPGSRPALRRHCDRHLFLIGGILPCISPSGCGIPC